MTIPAIQAKAKHVVQLLTESCIHVPGPPKVDCPECCEAVLVTALTCAYQEGQKETMESCGKLGEGKL